MRGPQFDDALRHAVGGRTRRGLIRFTVGLMVGAIAAGRPKRSGADHALVDGAHWITTAGVANVVVIDSLTPELAAGLRVAAAQWSTSPAVEVMVIDGDDSPAVRQNCPAPAQGQVRACNADYGPTDWIGLATYVFSTSSGASHMVWATTRFNEYFASDPDVLEYRLQIAQRNHCHELGHTLGLAHQTANATESGVSCLGLVSTFEQRLQPEYQQPNAADMAMLTQIYDHQHPLPPPPPPPQVCKRNNRKKGKKRKKRKQTCAQRASERAHHAAHGQLSTEALDDLTARAARVEVSLEADLKRRRRANERETVVTRELGNGYAVTIRVTWAEPQ